jgi:hypothetical protein
MIKNRVDASKSFLGLPTLKEITLYKKMLALQKTISPKMNSNN